MGAGYAKVPEVVTSYAVGRADIRDIVHPSYRDTAAVLGWFALTGIGIRAGLPLLE